MLARACEAFSVPGAGRSAVYGPVGGTGDDLPLSRPPAAPARRPAAAMLEKVGVELTTAGPVKARRLRQRAQLILDLLTPRGQSPIPS